MRASKIFLSIMGIFFLALASLVSHDKPTIEARAPTANANFSQWCSDIAEYPGSPGAIHVFCNRDGGSMTYISIVDLNKCLGNHNGAIVAQTNGGAMQSCTLGANGRNLCEDCSTAKFDFSCRDTKGGNVPSTVDLDDFIGLQAAYTVNARGDKLDVWVPSCQGNLGTFDQCTKDGVHAPYC